MLGGSVVLLPGLPILSITPDPEKEWMMVGHVIKDDEGLVFVGPCSSRPAVFLASLGPVRAILLSTHDHTRGSRY